MKNTLRGVNTFADPSFHQQNNALKEREWRVFFPIKFPRHGIYDVSAKICQRRAPTTLLMHSTSTAAAAAQWTLLNM
jgi:hypothetical protein